jgi:hypothetical protein
MAGEEWREEHRNLCQETQTRGFCECSIGISFICLRMARMNGTKNECLRSDVLYLFVHLTRVRQLARWADQQTPTCTTGMEAEVVYCEALNPHEPVPTAAD